MIQIYSLKKTVSDFFTKGHERSISAKKNILASFIIKGISIIISFFLVPMALNYINSDRYGIWLTLSSIVTWFAFFDIGFGNGMRNRFAESKAKGNIEEMRKYVSTTYAVLSIIFATVWILYISINFFIDWSSLLNAPEYMETDLSKLSVIVISFFCLQIVLKTINTILIADQEPAKSAFFDMLGQLLSLIIIYILIKTTHGSLLYLGMALGFAPVLIMIVSTLWYFNNQYRHIAPAIRYIDFSFAKSILNLGFKFFILQIGALVIFQTNNIIISHIMSSQSVTKYNVTYRFFSLLSMAYAIIVAPFWSAFTDAYTKKDFDWMRIVLIKLNNIWTLLLIPAFIMVVFSKYFFHLWLGDNIAIPFIYSVLISIYILIYSRVYLYHYIINGLGKVRLQLIIYGIICPAYIPLAVYACKFYGLPGIIAINILAVLIHAIISQIQVNKILNQKSYGIWNM